MANQFKVTFANGEIKTATTIMADQIRFEEIARRRGWGLIKEVPVKACSFFAFSALQRAKQFEGSWEDFLAAVVEVRAVIEDDSDADQGKAIGSATPAA